MGLLGGIVGTYCSLRKANLPDEQSHILRWAAYFCIGISLFLAVLALTPNPYRFYWFAPYSVVLPLAIYRCNRGQQRIREQELREEE